MSKPKKKPVDTVTERRPGHQLPTRVDDRVWAALERRAKKDRRSVSQLVRIIIEDHLTASGDLDPPDPDAP